MKNILVINSSAAGDGAASRVLVRNVIAELRAQEPDASVVERDVGRHPIPHLTFDALGGLRGVPETAAAQRTLELSDSLLAELRAADVLVIGAPRSHEWDAGPADYEGLPSYDDMPKRETTS